MIAENFFVTLHSKQRNKQTENDTAKRKSGHSPQHSSDDGYRRRTHRSNCYYNQPLLELIRHDLDITEQKANLITVITQIGYALGLFFLIPLGDMLSRKKLILVNMTIAALMAIVMAAAQNVWMLWGASLLIGACSVIPQFFIPIAGQFSEPKNKSRNMGIVLSGLLTGILASRVISGYIGEWLGWREMFIIAAFVMVVCMGIMLLMMPEMKRNYVGTYRG